MKTYTATRILFCLSVFMSLLSVTSGARAAPPVCNAGAEGVLVYNKDHKIMQYCDGTDWIGMGGVLSSVGAGDNLGNHTATQDLQLSGNDILNAATAAIGIATASDPLHVVGNIRIDNDTNTTNKGCIRYDGTANKLQFSHDCTTFSDMGTGSGGGMATMVPGWPDAILCNVTNPNWGPRILYLNSAPLTTSGNYNYGEPLSDSTDLTVSFSLTGNYVSASSYTTHNCNVSISSLYAAGRAFNFVGSGGGSGDNLGTHLATQALDMGGFNITNAGTVTATTFAGSGASLTALNGSNISTGTVAAARLPTFGTAAAGIVGASGGGTANFLRADGTWAAPAASLPGLASTNIWVGSAGGVATAVAMSGDATLSNTGVLTLGTGSVGTVEIVDGTIARIDLADSIINSSAIADGQVTGTDITDSTITTTDIAADTIAAADIATGAVGALEILNASIVATTELSATGTKDATTFLRGDNTWAVPSGGGTSTVSAYQAFTASGTWTKPVGIDANQIVLIEMWGGGGGGGSGASNSGGGGGGAYVRLIKKASDLAASVAVTVGTGGAATIAGNNSTFGSYGTAYGGGSTTSLGGGGGGGSGSKGAVADDTPGAVGGGPDGGSGGDDQVGGVISGGSSAYGGGGGGARYAPSSGNSGSGGDSMYGGGGGGGGGGGAQGHGGDSVYGGGGGANASASTTGGTSIYGGNGGTVGVAGSIPGGGGGRGAAGARGEVRVTVVP